MDFAVNHLHLRDRLEGVFKRRMWVCVSLCGCLLMQAVIAQAIPASAQSAASDCTVKQQGDNLVRSVVLRHVIGQVGVNVTRGRQMQRAFPNTPVIEGARLVSAEGYAEVLFEDLVHLRLTPSSVVVFEQLATHRSGERATVVRVAMGTIYVDTPNLKGTGIRLQVGQSCISVDKGTHLRLEVSPQRSTLAVYYGKAAVEASPGRLVEVVKAQTLPLHVDADSASIVAGIEDRPNDEWETRAVRRYQPYLRPPPSVWQ